VQLVYHPVAVIHIYTQTIHRTIQNKQYIQQHNNWMSAGRAPSVRIMYWLREIPGPVALHLCQNPRGQAWDRNRTSPLRKMKIKTTGGHKVAISHLEIFGSPRQSTDLYCPVRKVVGIRLVCDLAEINLRGQRYEDVL